MVETLTHADIKRMLLDACSDAELAVLIDHLNATRRDLVARLLVAPADADDAVQRVTVEITIREFREEQKRRAR